jgi:hypothetical protein
VVTDPWQSFGTDPWARALAGHGPREPYSPPANDPEPHAAESVSLNTGPYVPTYFCSPRPHDFAEAVGVLGMYISWLIISLGQMFSIIFPYVLSFLLGSHTLPHLLGFFSPSTDNHLITILGDLDEVFNSTLHEFTAHPQLCPLTQPSNPYFSFYSSDEDFCVPDISCVPLLAHVSPILRPSALVSRKAGQFLLLSLWSRFGQTCTSSWTTLGFLLSSWKSWAIIKISDYAITGWILYSVVPWRNCVSLLKLLVKVNRT